uniref:Uncharacterized protein n=1 Tax=Hordeum vulgare subsp. vulgare TaxID=112509 RepID=A0A8I6XKM3_HORVV
MAWSDDDRIPACHFCWDDRGICDRYPHLDNDTSFTVKLTDDFPIITVNNDEDHTYFGCSNWRAFCKAYGLNEDMNITFDLGNDDVRDNNIEIWVHAEDDLIPLLPPAYFHATRTTRKIVDRTYYSFGSNLTWLEKNHLISFIHDVDNHAKNYMTGNIYHEYVPLVHQLSPHNIISDNFVLPPETVPKWMFTTGDLEMVSLRPTVINYHGKYRISQSEDTLKINGWRNVIQASMIPFGEESLCIPQVVDRLICVLQYGDVGVRLYFAFLPRRE